MYIIYALYSRVFDMVSKIGIHSQRITKNLFTT